jgi:hypothetical protein
VPVRVQPVTKQLLAVEKVVKAWKINLKNVSEAES